MNRRQFLLQAAASTSLLPFPNITIHTAHSSADVLIVGAGLAGLHAAMLLEAAGKSVLVLEASKRVGGRLYTLDDIAWKPDTGGVQVGDGYKRVLAVASRLGVRLCDEPRSSSETLICLGDERIPSSAWERSPLNKLADKERSILPMNLESMLLRGKSPLKTLDDWRSPEFAPFDISIKDFLLSQGASEEALRLINIASDNPGIENTSILNSFRSATLFAQGGFTKSLMIEGGSSRLPEAMAKALKQPVQRGKIVRSVTQRGKSVTIQCADGSVFFGKYAIITIPFSALHTVAFSPALPGIQADAIRTIQYTTITQIHAEITKPFWLEDGLPASMWTDSPLERIFIFPASDTKPPRMIAWVNGAGAVALDKLTDQQITQLALSELKRLRPASEGAIAIVRINSWGRNPFARGSYVKFAPGQITTFAPHFPIVTRNLFFAGEHTALRYTGMEGALESAEHAVERII